MSKSFYFVFTFISLQHAQNPVAAQINRYSMTLSHQAQSHNDLTDSRFLSHTSRPRSKWPTMNFFGLNEQAL